jgi:hypothetical protein
LVSRIKRWEAQPKPGLPRGDLFAIAIAAPVAPRFDLFKLTHGTVWVCLKKFFDVKVCGAIRVLWLTVAAQPKILYLFDIGGFHAWFCRVIPLAWFPPAVIDCAA